MAAIASIQIARPAAALRARTVARVPRGAVFVVRAEASEAKVFTSEQLGNVAKAQSEPVVYYTNNKGARVSATPAEYEAAVASNQLYKASSITGVALGTETSGSAAVEEMSLFDTMTFSGPGPEIINGRLAMIAFVAAAAAEAATGKSVAEQFACEPTGVALLVMLLAAGSLVPLVKNVEVTNLGMFSAEKEMFNGRAAMLGFASLLVVEKVTGSAFF